MGIPLRRASGLVGVLLRRLGARFEYKDPLHYVERRRVIDNLFQEGPRARPFFARFVSLMLLSVAIATLGILADSTAVVIGAMLVAPLMGPVLGVAAALVMGWPRRVIRQSALIVIGSVLAVMLAVIIALSMPGAARPFPGELIARTSPNLLDLGIALAAGAVGAYGQVRYQASDALPGVAVAVALVPPLAVVGVSVQLTEWQMAFGALLLFSANVTGIVASATLTFIAAGFVPGRKLLSGNMSIASGLRWASIAVIVIVLPLQFGRGRVLPPADQSAEAMEAVVDFVDNGTSAAEVVSVAVEVVEGITDVEVVLASPAAAPKVSALARHLAEKLKTPVDVSLHVVETQRRRAIIRTP
jgi:uncharacterized hydrophobic protein (TIGR00271 family)